MGIVCNTVLGNFIFIEKRKEAFFVLDRSMTDVLRFISCLLVAGSHYAQYCETNNLSDNVVIRLLSTSGGYLGVAFFFFLSGYGLTCSMKNHSYTFGIFIKRRVKQVYLPAAFISLLWIWALLLIPHFKCVGAIINHGHLIGNGFSAILGILIFRFCDSVLWFVEILLLLNLVFYFYAVLTKVGRNLLSFFVLLVGTTAIMLYTFFHVGPFAVVSIPLFLIGVLVATYGEWIINNKYKLVLIISLVLFLLAFVFRRNFVFIHGVINYYLLLMFLFVTSIWNISFSKIPKIIPKMSYDLYLTHNKLKAIIAAYSPSLSILIFLFLSVLLSLLSCYLRKMIKI